MRANLGGAIDFASPTARNSVPLELFVGGGSFGIANGRLTAGEVAGDWDGLVTVDEKQRDGYRGHSRQDRSSVYANVGWQPSAGVDLRLFATHIENDEQLAGALTRAQFDADSCQANPSAITGNFQLNVRIDRAAAKGTWIPDETKRLELGLSYEDQNLYHPIVDKILVDFDGAGPNAPVEVFSLLKNTDQRTYAGVARYNISSGAHDVLIGLNVADTRETGGNFRNDGGRRNGQTGIINNQSDSAELFVVDRWAFAPGWTLVYGAQGVRTARDVRTTELASGTVRNPRRDYSSINPRLGVLRAITPTSEAFASVSRLFEAPTTFELTDDLHGGNATLDPMQGTVVEAGLRGATKADASKPRWHWDTSVYYARIRDEILSVDSPVAPGTSLSANIHRTTHGGIEALVGVSLPLGNGVDRIEPLLSASYNRFFFDGDLVYGDNRLPAAPAYAMRGEVIYRHGNGFLVGPTFDWVGSRYADFSNSYRLAGYHLFGLRAGIRRDRWQVFGELRNLTDQRYVGTMSVRDRTSAGHAVLQPGAPRSVSAGARLSF
ncbi:MAG: TonB-dependent receptor family protein [Pseudomonadota bacterium]